MTADSLTRGQYLNLIRPVFFVSVQSFMSRDFQHGRTWLAGGVDRQSRTGLIFTVMVSQEPQSYVGSDVAKEDVGACPTPRSWKFFQSIIGL